MESMVSQANQDRLAKMVSVCVFNFTVINTPGPHGNMPSVQLDTKANCRICDPGLPGPLGPIGKGGPQVIALCHVTHNCKHYVHVKLNAFAYIYTSAHTR
jgi:hypothetical protein